MYLNTNALREQEKKCWGNDKDQINHKGRNKIGKERIKNDMLNSLSPMRQD